MSAHVLIVDDSPILMNLLRAHLRAEGFEVSTADDYAQVAACLCEHKPDLILLDTTVHDFAGWEMCARLCQRSGIPILYITAPDVPGRSARAFEPVRGEVLAKPFSFDTLLRRIEGLLVKHRGISAA